MPTATATPSSARRRTARPRADLTLLQGGRGAAAAAPGDLAHLRGACAGRVLAPGDEGWDVARRAWNLAVDQRPAAVVLPETAADVAATLRHAAATGLRVAPQATGHGAGPLPALDDAILLRTAGLTGVTVDAARRRARVAAGTPCGDLALAASAHGLSALVGSAPDLGVTGFTLHGGLSWLARPLGLASSHVRALEVVTADGEQHRVDAEHEPDLFWALRGGGGAFGVVTALEVELHDLGRPYAGAMFFPLARAAEVVPAWTAWAAEAPESVTTSLRLVRFPGLPHVPSLLRGGAYVVIDGALVGDDLAPLDALRALRPEIDTFTRVPPSALSRLHLEPDEPLPAATAHALLGDAPQDLVDGLLAVAGPDSGCRLPVVELRQLGGALAREPEGAGALGRIDGAFSLLAIASPAPGVDEQLAAVEAAAAGHTVGAYRSFAGRPTAGAAFAPEVLARLRAVKAAYDPGDLVLPNHPLVD